MSVVNVPLIHDALLVAGDLGTVSPPVLDSHSSVHRVPGEQRHRDRRRLSLGVVSAGAQKVVNYFINQNCLHD